MPGFGDFDPRYFFAIIVTFVIAITVHEFMHAWTAWKLGDDTAKQLGRITLNPAAHFDPLGFFLFVLIALGYPAFAWGKPVQTNPANYTKRFSTTTGHMLVAAAGPFMNLVLAVIVSVVIVVLG